MRKNITLDMTEGNVVKKILLFAIPLLISTIFQQCYNLADTMIISHNLGENSIAAVGATTVFFTLLICFSSGLNSGYGIVIARAFGAKDTKAIRKSFAAMIVLNILITILLTVLSIVFAKNVLHLMSTPEEIFDEAYRYIIIILAGMAATVCYNMWDGFLRAVGNSRTTLYFLTISCILNVALDLIFIRVFHMGVGGAAIATVIAEGVSALTSGIYVFRKYKEYLPGREDFRLDKQLVTEMFSTGIAMALMLSINQVGNMIFQRSVNNLGTTIIAAHTAARKIYEFLMMPLATLASANATFVSQNFGAGKMKRIREGIRKVMAMECIWWGASCLIAFPFGRMLVRGVVGTANMEIINNANMYLCWSVAFFLPLALLFVLRTSLQSLGYKKSPVIASVIEIAFKIFSCVVIIPVLGYFGVSITEPIHWTITAVFLLVVYAASSSAHACGNSYSDTPSASHRSLCERH